MFRTSVLEESTRRKYKEKVIQTAQSRFNQSFHVQCTRQKIAKSFRQSNHDSINTLFLEAVENKLEQSNHDSTNTLFKEAVEYKFGQSNHDLTNTLFKEVLMMMMMMMMIMIIMMMMIY